MNAGTVSSLWRYPVKSLLGEACRALEIDTRGIKGDRLFALRDGDGKFGSGKNSRRFRGIDGLFTLRAKYSGDCLEIAFPDGRQMRGDDPRVPGILSEVLGVSVTLAREAEISHFDNGAVHLMSTAALAWLRSRLPDSRIDERRFRPNIVVTTPGIGQIERSWIGRTLRIGGEVKLRVTETTERCRMTTIEQLDLPDDPNVLRCLAQQSEMQFGVYAEVAEAGRIAHGDPVVID